MELHVHWSGIAASNATRERLERRLAFALGRFGSEIGQVWARLADENGLRGGVDKRVSLRVRGRRLVDLLVTDRDSNLDAAIDRACDRIGRATARAIDRARSRTMRGWDGARTRGETRDRS